MWKSKFYGAFVLNRRVDLYAIDATPARWRGDATCAPTHWLISIQVDAIGRRYADGFHSSASDPSLKAKYGNAKADYSHLPPPPTFGAPPPPPPPASY